MAYEPRGSLCYIVQQGELFGLRVPLRVHVVPRMGGVAVVEDVVHIVLDHGDQTEVEVGVEGLPAGQHLSEAFLSLTHP